MEIGPLLARMLESRGITNKQDINDYLNPDLDRDWTNPYEIKGMQEVADAVEIAIRKGKHITVYGDYDVDGISATAVMIKGLRAIDKHINAGTIIDYFLPNRFNETYGFTEKSVNRLLSQYKNTEVIISVDCGVTAANEIKTLQDAGIEVIITDHHAKSEGFPTGVPIIDPEAEDDINENAILSGVGVALKLIQCLGGRLGLPNLWYDFLDLATLGTLADVMPLIGQNRSLVSAGIKQINSKPSTAIRSLLDVAGKQAGNLTSTDIAYVLTPRLNSAGRMEKADLAVNLLLCEDYSQAYNLAIEIEGLNNNRKQITNELIEQANYQAKNIVNNNPDVRSLVLYGENWHPGVLGIVAAKIAENFCVPAIVMTINGDTAHGSGRSVGDINLHEACMKSFDSYLKFGGHAGACGVSIKAEDIDTFAKNLDNYMNTLEITSFKKTFNVDIEVRIHELNTNDIEQLDYMEPFGNQNEAPLFLTKNVFIKRARAVGQNNNHLSCNITDGAYGGHGIMFNVSDIEKYLKMDSTVCIVYNPKIEVFSGQKYAKMFLRSIIPSNEFDHEINPNEHNTYVNQLFEKFSTNTSQGSCVGDFINNSIKELHEEKLKSSFIEFENSSDKPATLREKFSKLDLDEVQGAVISAMIGQDAKLHSSQQETLDKLALKKSVLSVMPTGRGKSLIFQVFAATLAIKENKTSIFVYPLRALISDQAFHLEKSLGKFGLNIKVLNGETSSEDRKNIYELLSLGEIDIILTTPEFLAIHVNKIASAGKIGFIVIDEAHHMGQVKVGDRTAYGHMPDIIEKLNHPQVLALSATVNDEVCNEIRKFLPIEEIVKDNFERENLFVDDRRNIKCRDDYLVSLCASGQKIVIYVNSRQQTVDLARMIKSRAPHVAMQVGFYNAGMTKQDRKKIESLFRDNTLSVLVATSAFGEGVNIPDIRHVCLYHLPFSNVEFNQMAGRCGRDNNPAIVHLLYNRADATINTQILQASNPGRDVLAKIYTWFKANYDSLGGAFELCNDQLMQMYEQHLVPAPPGAVMSALDIFSELGFINVKTLIKESSTYSRIEINEMQSKVNLENSSRYCEGCNEVNNFEEYRHTAMRRTADELTELLRHPILPSEI